MNVSQSRRKETNSIKKMQNSTEIDALYHQFESLKSQIYGVKRQPKPKHIDTHWTNKNNKDKAVEMLRESTIHKCQQELQQNLTMIQSSQPKFKKKLFNKNSQIPSESDDYVDELKNSFGDNRYSKKLKEYSEDASLNLQQSLRQQMREGLHFAQGELIFREFLNSNERINIAELSASRRQQVAQSSISASLFQSLIAEISQDHLKKLNFLLQTLTFMSRKLHCLQLIILEYGKVLKAKNEHSYTQRAQQSQIIFSVQAIQRKYEVQMKKLSQFYQQQLKKQTNRHAQNQMRASVSLKNDQSSAIQKLKEDNHRLSELLKQAKDLITTKEEFILSLTEQNQELKDEVQKWKRPNMIRGSAQSSLGYSVTADKHPKKDNSAHQMGHIAQRLQMALGQGEKRQWDQFEEGSSNDINYSELQSVRSVKNKSIEDWDISHLEMRQNSNAKSIEEDCLRIMANRKQHNDNDNDDEVF